jgi:DNA-binding response OmpR family regulator
VVARFGSFTLDSDQRRIVGAEGEAHLTPKAFDLLRLLIRHAPRVVSKPEIHAALWPDTFVSDAALIVLIKEIRRSSAIAMPARQSSARFIASAMPFERHSTSRLMRNQTEVVSNTALNA